MSYPRPTPHQPIRRSNLLIRTTLDHSERENTKDHKYNRKQISKEDVLSEYGVNSTVSSNNPLLSNRVLNNRNHSNNTMVSNDAMTDGCLVSCFPHCRKPTYHPGQTITGTITLRPAFRTQITGRCLCLSLYLYMYFAISLSVSSYVFSIS